MELFTVDQLREKYPKYKDSTDEEISEKYLTHINKVRDYENESPANYYSFIRVVNPNSPDSNLQKYKSNLDPDLINEKSDGQHAYDVFKKLKEERNLPMRFRDFVEEYAPRFSVQSTPGSGQYSAQKTERVKQPYSDGEIADITGVARSDPDFTTVKSRAIGSLAMDEKNLAQAIRNEASRYFGQDVKVRRGPDTNQLEFFNPKQGRFQLVNKPGLDLGDFSSLTGDLAVSIGEILGTIGGSVVGPVGSIGGGAIGATAGDMARMYVGHEFFDINPNLKDFDDYLSESYSTGAISAVSGTLFKIPGMTSAIKNVYNKLMDKKEISDADLAVFEKEIGDVKKLKDKMNARIADNKLKSELKFNLGQVTNDPELLAWASAFETHSKYGVKGEFHQMNKNNAAAVKDLFELFRQGFVSKNLLGKNAEGYDIVLKRLQDKAVTLNSAERKPLIEALQKSEDDLSDAVLQFPNGIKKEGGQSIKSGITEFQDLRRKDIEKKYKTLFKGTDESEGMALRKLPLDRDTQTYKVIDDALKKISARGKQTLMKNYPSIKSMINMPKKGQEITFQTLHNTRSDLLRLKRNLEAKKLTAENTPDEQQLNKLVRAINKQMDDSLGTDDPMLKMYRTIDDEAKSFYEDYNRFIGQLVQKNGGRLNIGDEDIFLTTFKTGKTQQSRIDDVFDVLKTDSEKMDLYKNNILEYYMSKVDPQNLGKINLGAHRKFIEDHKYGLEKFFGKDSYKEITNVGNLQKKVDDINKQNNEISKKLSKTTAGQIENRDPEEIYDFAFSPSQFGGARPTKLKELMNIIKDDEITKNEFKTLVSQRLMLQSTDPMDFTFNAKNFNKFLAENKENLKIVFADDKKYLADLNDFNKVLSILDRKTKDAPPERFRSALRDLIRAKVGMFTVAGRTMTAGIKISEDMLNKKMAQIIQNPEELTQLIKLADKPPSFLQTEKGKAIVKTLFGSIPAMQQFDVTPDLEDVRQKDIERTKKIDIDDQSAAPSPSVDMFAMEQAPRPTEPAPIAPPPVQQPQPAGIASLPQDRGQTYAGLFPNDPSGQMIAQRGTQDAGA